ncbi:MAG: RNA polymerase sigma factor [Alphaproteobacteria bacterium]|nr:MAG: RNA polymerase sigma factor [Alphaproteobacteria bacterium]
MQNIDLILAQKASKGDKAAFQQLLERHYDKMYRLAYRFTGHRQDAEDIVQDICLKLVDKLQAFRGDSNFSTWLYRVILNACKDFCKSRGRARNLEKTFEELQEFAREDSKDHKHKSAWLHNALNQIEPELRDTAILILDENLTHAEAGKILDCAEATVSWRLFEVRKKLKQIREENHG